MYIINTYTWKLHNADKMDKRCKMEKSKNRKDVGSIKEALAYVPDGKHLECCGICMKNEEIYK